MVDPSLRFGGRQRRSDAHVLSGHFVRDHTHINERPKGTTDWLLLVTLTGAGFAASGDAHLHLTRGHIACYQPNTPQYYGTDPDHGHWELIWCHVDIQQHWLEYLQWPIAAPGLLHLRITDDDLYDEIVEAMRLVHQGSNKWTITNDKLASNAVERTLLLAHMANPGSNESAQVSRRIQNALSYLASNNHRPVSMDELAEHCNCSSSRLSVQFREEVGMSPIRYHEHERLHRASHMLRDTDLSIADVAAAVGFDDPFYFSNRFRKQFGSSPRAFRAKCTS